MRNIANVTTKPFNQLCFAVISCYLFQNCASLLKSLQTGEFGSCESEIESYRAKCKEVFPRATLFASGTPNGITEKPNISEIDGLKEIKDGMS